VEDACDDAVVEAHGEVVEVPGGEHAEDLGEGEAWGRGRGVGEREA
jgi:hypothetical protein